MSISLHDRGHRYSVVYLHLVSPVRGIVGLEFYLYPLPNE